MIEISFIPAILTRPALKGIALGIGVAPLCTSPITHFLAIFDIELLTMRLAFARDYGGPSAKKCICRRVACAIGNAAA